MKTLKQRLADGETVNVFAIGRVFHPNMIEMYSILGGFHGFWIDHEHAGFTIREIETAAAFGRATGLDSFVRIPPHDYSLVTRCLESGTGGVMAAQITSAEHAEEFVQWSKFAPRGRRGLNTSGFDGRFGNASPKQFCPEANENNFLAIQIETTQAVEECDGIAAIEGVDQLFVGPADLSQALGVTGDFMHEKCIAAIKKVAVACEKHGKSFGALTTSPEHARMLIDNGCRLISITNDVKTFGAGIKSVKETFSELFETR